MSVSIVTKITLSVFDPNSNKQYFCLIKCIYHEQIKMLQEKMLQEVQEKRQEQL